ncbi:MAG TPA: hypothetical protein VIN40_10685 [Candidatus Tyrphobacter sp.]
MISASRLYEILQRVEVRSVVDPFMGVPTHLNYLKQHGLAVHGAELSDWLVRAGEGIVVNDSVVLLDRDISEIVEMLPGHVYALDTFKAWEGAFFTQEQCLYLSVWHENVHALRSDAQTGLAVLGLWRAFCYWMHKSEAPDEMQDVAPSELAWHYLRQTTQWVGANARRNTVRRADALAITEACPADALLLALPFRNAYRSPDARLSMWEAWWQGDPYFSHEHAYRHALFGVGASEPADYARTAASLLARASEYPVIVLATDEKRAAEMESLLRAARRDLEIVAASPDEVYLIAKR